MVKLLDIALKTGLNVSTVSRALRDSSDISEDTRKLAKRAAQELGYHMRRDDGVRNRTIAVIMPEVTSHYYAELAHTLTDELRKKDYDALISLCGFSAKELDKAYDMFMKQDICGLIICGIAEKESIQADSAMCKKLIKSEMPVVLLTEINTTIPLDIIYVDEMGYMQIAVDHLVNLGHRKIGYVGEYTSDLRLRAMCTIMEQKGLKIRQEYIKRGRERFELGGYLRTKELLAEKELPTAIVASYDQVAIGALKALDEAGIRVPEDISVLGIDNIVLDDYLPVKLTSITNPAGQIGIVAVKLLMDCIDDPDGHIMQNVALISKLVERESTAPPKEQAGAVPTAI